MTTSFSKKGDPLTPDRPIAVSQTFAHSVHAYDPAGGASRLPEHPRAKRGQSVYLYTFASDVLQVAWRKGLRSDRPAENGHTGYYLPMLTWDEDLRLSSNNLYFDSRVSRARCFVSHAHSD